MTSELPEMLETARLPVLATVTPAAAVTSDEAVEMLNLAEQKWVEYVLRRDVE